MKRVCCVLDLDETLGHFNTNHQFMVRPFALLLLDFFIVTHIDIVLWSYGSDSYVEHVINTHFDIFKNENLKTRLFARSVCEISKRRYGNRKHSKIVRSLYKETVYLIAIDDQVNINMDTGYDFRIKVEPYIHKNVNDRELLFSLQKIIEQLKEIILNSD